MTYERWAHCEAAIEAHNGKTQLDGAKMPLMVKFADAKTEGGGGAGSAIGKRSFNSMDAGGGSNKKQFSGMMGGGGMMMGGMMAPGMGFGGGYGMGGGSMMPQGGIFDPMVGGMNPMASMVRCIAKFYVCLPCIMHTIPSCTHFVPCPPVRTGYDEQPIRHGRWWYGHESNDGNGKCF